MRLDIWITLRRQSPRPEEVVLFTIVTSRKRNSTDRSTICQQKKKIVGKRKEGKLTPAERLCW